MLIKEENMRTKTEILKEIEYFSNEAADCDHDFPTDAHHYRNIATWLNWAIEESEYKRTIFELTNNELLELASILTNTDIKYLEFITHFYSEDKCVKYAVKIPVSDTTYDLYIYQNLDVSITSSRKSKITDKYIVSSEHISNIEQYLNTIKEMLFKSKKENNDG